jgi:diguanylate cyclase (GGDEF)-like protein
MMPGLTGIEVLRLIRATYSPGTLAVIMLTGIGESDKVVEALDQGANDYVVKPADIAVVLARVKSHLERSRAERTAKHIDFLTGLGNRDGLLARLEAALRRPADGAFEPLAIILLDIDGLKLINDSLGNAAGDKVLQHVAAGLESVRIDAGLTTNEGCLSRVGAHKFALLHQSASAEQVSRLVDQIRLRMATPLSVGASEVVPSTSIGVVLSTQPSPVPEELLRDADLALCRAKELGKNRSEFYQPCLRDRAETRMVRLRDLPHAVEGHEFVLEYQPIIDLATGTIAGFEALLRWNHPRLGRLAPAEFIPLAEETGLIVPIGAWILTEACRQLKEWQTGFPLSRPLAINVNLSPRQLTDPNIIGLVKEVLCATDIRPGTLKLELTESAMMTEVESAWTVLADLQSLQVRLKLDDFGTGYSSLSYLHALHFDSIKIDRSFVSRLGMDPAARAVIEMMISMAHELRMTVVAEGIENDGQLAELSRMRCDLGQGYLLGRPLPYERAEALLESQVRRASVLSLEGVHQDQPPLIDPANDMAANHLSLRDFQTKEY